MIKPTVVGTTTIAMTIQIEFVNEVQKSSSVRSFCQFSSPMKSGVPTPRHFVKVRYTFHSSGTMTITRFEPNRLVTYASTQPGLPDARHERWFEADGAGFVYRLVVEYEPRPALSGLFDRVLLARGIRRAFEQTFDALDRELWS